MPIRNAHLRDHSRLLEIWEAAVRATHAFLTDDHIVFYRRRLGDTYLHEVELAVATDEADKPLAFMGMTPPVRAVPGSLSEPRLARIAMLFVDPSAHRKGLGRALVEHAVERYGELETDVNEQNPGALAFYLKCGFAQVGRSETDEEGNPFPLLHLHRQR